MSSTKTIGIIGGGQLGQMMAISAIYMGHKVITKLSFVFSCDFPIFDGFSQNPLHETV